MSYDFNRAIQIFKDAVTNQYWDVDGRTSRSDFWHYVSISFGISIIMNIIISIVPLLSIVSLIISLALLGPGIGMSVRRMHDIGHAWWFMLIPFYNIYLACQPGDQGANQFGEDPLGGSAAVFE